MLTRMHCRTAFTVLTKGLKPVVISQNFQQYPFSNILHNRCYARFQNSRSLWKADKDNLELTSYIDCSDKISLPITSKPLRINSSEVAGNDRIFSTALPEDVEDVGKQLKPSYTIAAYVNESETLQQLVKLGVDLSKIEKKRELASYVLQLNFERDVKPYIRFLHDVGVHPDNIGSVLTNNITICQQAWDDLQVRLNYLESKKFTNEEIASIITRNPFWLSTSVAVIDSRLGWLQKTFRLTGDEVRLVVNTSPKLVTYNLNAIKLNLFVLEEEIGMSKGMLKKLIKTKPKIFVINQQKLLTSFEYVSNVMNVPMDLICAQPDILMERRLVIKERHEFLKSLGRAQYNPRLPGYVSLDALIKCDDAQFCQEIAKTPINAFHIFLKTL